MANPEMKRFVYFGRNPSNVVFNGVSLPVMPGDIVKCYPDFIAAFLKREEYKEAPSSLDSKPAKYTLGRQPFFMKKDPTGGLPIRTDPDSGPKLREKMGLSRRAVSPALMEESLDQTNPYELPEGSGPDEKLEKTLGLDAPKPERRVTPGAELEDGKLVITTSGPQPLDEAVKNELSAPREVQPGLTVQEPVDLVDDGISIEDDEDEEAFLAEAEEEEELEREPEPEIPAPVAEATEWGRTDLRKKGRDDILDVVKVIVAEGAPLNPDMLEEFQSFDNETTRGVAFEAIWRYHGYDD